MRYVFLISLFLCVLACKKKSDPVVNTNTQRDPIDTSMTPQEPVKPDTNYFDSLDGSHNGVSHYVGGTTYVDEGYDVMVISIDTVTANPGNVMLMDMKCKRFSMTMELHDSLKKKQKFTLVRISSDTVDEFHFDNGKSPAAGRFLAYREVDRPQGRKIYSFISIE